MSGTDRTIERAHSDIAGPVVILARPQLGENIGMVARAMLNTGLTELRLVGPRDGWPSESAEAAAAGADIVLDQATVFDDLRTASADLELLYATSTRPRDLTKIVLTPEEAVRRTRRAIEGEGLKVGFLFGPERSGLSNDDLSLTDGVITVPLNPGFSSLNLAQAVLLLGYAWFNFDTEAAPAELAYNVGRPATKAELENFMARLEAQLNETGFLYPPEKRPNMVNNLRALFGRMALTESEVNTLHGIISALRSSRGQDNS